MPVSVSSAVRPTRTGKVAEIRDRDRLAKKHRLEAEAKARADMEAKARAKEERLERMRKKRAADADALRVRAIGGDGTELGVAWVHLPP